MQNLKCTIYVQPNYKNDNMNNAVFKAEFSCDNGLIIRANVL